MIEKDLEYITRILKDLHYKPSYIEVLINHIIKRFDDSSITEITPQFIYTSLAFEEGKHNAKRISEYFEDLKNKGSYNKLPRNK